MVAGIFEQGRARTCANSPLGESARCGSDGAIICRAIHQVSAPRVIGVGVSTAFSVPPVPQAVGLLNRKTTSLECFHEKGNPFHSSFSWRLPHEPPDKQKGQSSSKSILPNDNTKRIKRNFRAPSDTSPNSENMGAPGPIQASRSLPRHSRRKWSRSAPDSKSIDATRKNARIQDQTTRTNAVRTRAGVKAPAIPDCPSFSGQE